MNGNIRFDNLVLSNVLVGARLQMRFSCPNLYPNPYPYLHSHPRLFSLSFFSIFQVGEWSEKDTMRLPSECCRCGRTYPIRPWELQLVWNFPSQTLPLVAFVESLEVVVTIYEVKTAQSAYSQLLHVCEAARRIFLPDTPCISFLESKEQ